MPVVHVAVLGHEERSASHAELWSFEFPVLAIGIVRGNVPHLRDRVDEVSSECLLTLCDGEHDPCSPRFPDIMM